MRAWKWLGSMLCGMLLSAAAHALTPISLTNTAQSLAGVTNNIAPTAAGFSHWQQHHKTLAPLWKSYRDGQQKRMISWRRDAFDAENCRDMLYPFSGPDFLNAYTMFPDCDQYIFFGLEKPGRVPDISRMNEQQLASLLSDFRIAINDVLERNYFITGRMMTQLQTPHLQGVTPVIVATMGALDLTIISVQHHTTPFKSVRIEFRRPNLERTQVLWYYSLDATNEGLKQHNPAFLSALRQVKPAYTMLKAASYLLHAPEFTDVRDVIIDVSAIVVQDDTGIPYKFFLNKKWQVELFGQYAAPIPDFNYGYQPDLERAYRAAQPDPLRFSYGYHWRHGNSGIIVATRLYNR